MENEQIREMIIQLAQDSRLSFLSDKKLKLSLDGLTQCSVTDIIIARDEILLEMALEQPWERESK